MALSVPGAVKCDARGNENGRSAFRAKYLQALGDELNMALTLEQGAIGPRPSAL